MPCASSLAPSTVGTDFVCADLVISTILFDMNDVLHSYDRSARVAHIARICREPAAAVAEAIWESGFEDRGDSGVMDADAYLSSFGERPTHPFRRLRQSRTFHTLANGPKSGVQLIHNLSSFHGLLWPLCRPPQRAQCRGGGHNDW